MGKLAKYSTMAIQMGLSILIGVYAGKWLDEQAGLTTPWFTLLCILVAVGGSIFHVYRQTMADNQ